MLQAQHLEDVHSAVHACNNSHVPLGVESESNIGEMAYVCLVVVKEFVSIWGEVARIRHRDILPQQVA